MSRAREWAVAALFVAVWFVAMFLSACASSSNTPDYWSAVSHSVGEHVGRTP